MYTFSSHASAGTGARARRLVRLRHSAMALSIGVLLAAPAYAQQAPLTNAGGSAVDLDTVEVRGVRASLIKSQVIKRDASQIVDSVSAEDIGALPDRSVTETLQRQRRDHRPLHGTQRSRPLFGGRQRRDDSRPDPGAR